MKITDLDEDNATFLPALGISIQNVSRPLSSLRSKPPKNITSVEQYNLLNPDDCLWQYPKILYSAGHADFDTSSGKERALIQRDKSKTFVLADSGGYQVISNASTSQNCNWNDPADVELMCHDTVWWMEQMCDVGIILDIPIQTPKMSAHFVTEDMCLDQTVTNAKHFFKHRTTDLPLLCVIQGWDFKTMARWYDAQKHLNNNGWCFGGKCAKNFKNVLLMLEYMKQHGEFDTDKPQQIHFFMVSGAQRFIIYNAIQKALRISNPNLRITFDSAASSRKGGQEYKMTSDEKSSSDFETWKVLEHLPRTDAEIGTSPFTTPGGQKLTRSELLLNATEGHEKTDTLTAIIMTAHNVYKEVDEMTRVKELVADALSQQHQYFLSAYGSGELSDRIQAGDLDAAIALDLKDKRAGKTRFAGTDPDANYKFKPLITVAAVARAILEFDFFAQEAIRVYDAALTECSISGEGYDDEILRVYHELHVGDEHVHFLKVASIRGTDVLYRMELFDQDGKKIKRFRGLTPKEVEALWLQRQTPRPSLDPTLMNEAKKIVDGRK